MIKYLPKIYPNELCYSYLSRIYAHSGFNANVGFSSEILPRNKGHVNYEFINEFKSEFKELLEKNISYEELLLNHTLFKYYARFLTKDKKKEAYEYALTNKALLFHKLPVALNKDNYYLRYCPVCVSEDREKYGEAYFHVNHFFPFVHICPSHYCELIDTDYRINSNVGTIFIPLEEMVDSMEVKIYDESSIGVRVSKYINEVFEGAFDLVLDGSIGKYLTQRLGEDYISTRYKKKDIEKILNDFNDFYKNLNDYSMLRRRLEYTYSVESKNAYDICLIALFEGISANDLLLYKGYKEDDFGDVDEDVWFYYHSGLDYSKISRRVGVSKQTVRRIIVGGRDKTHGWTKAVKGKSRFNWDRLDEKYSKRFYKEVNKMIKKNSSFKVCKKSVAEIFGIKDKRLKRFPKLVNKIEEWNNI